MIASVMLQSMDSDDDNFSPVFFRKRQEFYLELSDKAKSDLRKVTYFLSSSKFKIFLNILIDIMLESGITPPGENGLSTDSVSSTPSPISCWENSPSEIFTLDPGSFLVLVLKSQLVLPYSPPFVSQKMNGMTKPSKTMEFITTGNIAQPPPSTAGSLKRNSGWIISPAFWGQQSPNPQLLPGDSLSLFPNRRKWLG